MPEETLVRNKARLGMEYKFNAMCLIILQAFRPVLFSDLTMTNVIDPNLKDASGFNADLV
jgi:Fe(3+) dicitrate transport protein